MRIHPSAFHFGRTGTDEDGAWGAKGNQLMRVHRQVVRRERAGVFQKIPGHPVILAGTGDVLHQLAEIAAAQLRATFAR